MSKTIVLVSCVKSKSNKPQPARDLYTSTLFKGCSAYAEKFGDEWYILSAKYGLLNPSQVVAPYEKTLNNMLAAERRTWAKGVLSDLKRVIVSGDEIIFLAGKRYREYLIKPLEKLGCKISIPMEGLPFGKQLRWLKVKGQFPREKSSKTTSGIPRPREPKMGGAMSLANQIRNHVIENVITPARQAGKATVTITAKDIHKELGLKRRYPAVCSALDGDIFKEQAGVIARSRSGPQQSSTVRWVFEII